MDLFLHNLIPYLLTYKYLALFIISFIAAYLIPIPSGSLLMVASALASEGYFNFGFVIVISIVGNLLGDNLSYLTSRYYGEKIFSFIGFRKIINSKTFKLMEDNFRKRPGFIVLASRFEVLCTLSVNILSGLSKVPYRKFLLHESIGTVSQVLFYGLIGYLFGYNWQSTSSISGKISIAIIFLWIFLIIILWKKIFKYFTKSPIDIDK